MNAVPALALSPDVIQLIVYGGIAAGGYLLRHLNVFGHSTTPSSAPSATSSTPILNSVLPAFEQQLIQVLQTAAQRLIQQPAATNPPAPTVKQ